MTIEVPPDLTATLRQMADTFGITPEEAATELLAERARISTQTAAALKDKQAIGEHVGSVPFGFAMDRQGGHLVADESEAAVVARIVELRTAGGTLQAIANILTADGTQTKRGGEWAPSQVWNILRRAGR